MPKVTDLNEKRRQKGTKDIEEELDRVRGLAAQHEDGKANEFDRVERLRHMALKKTPVYRKRAAIAMFAKGADYDEITEALELDNREDAKRIIEMALAQTIDEGRDPKRLRAKVNLQLDAVTRSVMPRATDPDDPEHILYARTALSLFERKAKLNGLDAPTVHLINPDNEELDRLVQEWAVATGNEPAPQVDIFALSEGPDGTFRSDDE